MAAQFPSTWPQIDDVIGSADCGLVVFDYQHRVAQVAQMLEGLDELLIVPLVEADTGLVKDVEHPHQLRANLRGQTNPLCLAARERSCPPIQGQIVQPHIYQESQTRHQLLDDLSGYESLSLTETLGQALAKVLCPIHRHPREFIDGDAANGDSQALGAQPATIALWATGCGHVLLNHAPGIVRGSLLVATFEIRYHSLECGLVDACAAILVCVAHGHRLATTTVEDNPFVFTAQLSPRRINREAIVVRHSAKNIRKVAIMLAGFGPGLDSPLRQRQVWVRNDEVGVQLLPVPQARAGRTGSVGAVEGETARLEFREADATPGTGISF